MAGATAAPRHVKTELCCSPNSHIAIYRTYLKTMAKFSSLFYCSYVAYLNWSATCSLSSGTRMTTTKRTLLLIDNNPSHSDIFQGSLLHASDGPFHGERAVTLAEGVERLKGKDIWAVFLNLSLPDSQGIETFDRLSQLVPGVPTLVLGSATDEQIALEALRHGAKDYLLEDHLDEHAFVRAIRNMAERKSAEETLFIEKEYAQVALNSIGDGVLCSDNQLNITYLNAVAEKMTGWTLQQALGKPVTEVFEIIDGDTREPSPNPLETAIGKNKTAGLAPNRLLICRDRHEFAIEDSAAPIHDRHGSLTGAVIVFHDVSRSRLADESLRNSEEQYRMLLDGIQDYAIFMLDPQGRVLSWNAGAERIKGYKAEQIIGQNFSCFFPQEDIKRGRPEEILRMTAASGRQQEQGMRVRKDGSRFLANATLTALRDRSGSLRGFSEFSHDLSESKESGARYRGLLEAAPDAMVVVNQDGEIVLLNVQAEKQFGYRRDELIGQKVKNIIPEGFAERLIADSLRSAADALAQQIGTGIELSGRRKDGSEFPIEIMLSPLESAEGILVTAAIRNITMRKKAEANLLQKVEELNRSNEELGQFANIASHDLQEPLRMVASYTQLLSIRYKGKLDSDADEFIAFAVDGANRMQRLIHDLLAYSRVGTKGRDLLDTSSEEALQQALSNLRGAIEESGALVTYDPLPVVQADEMQLVQLFQNLVGNGIKYQSHGVPQVHIFATREAGEKWLFSVRDNGLGIDPQYFERIFGMFQRLHKREEFAGTGIGLAICKKIVERHGGRISVESQLGQGSTFRFSLAGSEGKS